MDRIVSGVLMAALMTASQPSPAAAPDEIEFVIIVHQANPLRSISMRELSMIFLKKKLSWDNGTPCRPIDLEESSSIRVDFSRQVLGKRVPAVNAYWQQMIFSGRAAPPPIERTEEAVVDFVRSHRGAVGYVSGATATDDGVRMLSLSD